MQIVTHKHNTTLKIVFYAYRFASLIKSVPFEVVSNNGRLEINGFTKWHQMALWQTVNWIIFLYAAYHPVGFLQVLLRDGWTEEASLHVHQLVLYMLGVLYFGSFYRKPWEFVETFNGVYELIQTHTRSKSYKAQPWFSIPLLSFGIFYFGTVLIGSFVVETGIYVLNSDQSRYIFSVLPRSVKQQMVVWIITIGLELMVVLWIFSLLMVTFCHYCAFVFQAIIWLIYLKSSMLKSNGMREWMKLIKFYRRLQILFAIHHDYGRDFHTGFLVAMGITETLFLYCTLESYTLHPLLVYWMFPTFVVFVFILVCLIPPTGTIKQRKSREFIFRLCCQTGKRPEFLEVYKEARSLREVNIELSHFCDASINSSFVVMTEVFNHLLLLLSLKS